METKDNINEKEEKENSATDALGALVKQIKAMWIAIFVLVSLCLVVFGAFVGTNIYWINVFQSYDYVSQDGDGQNYYNHEVGGDVYNGSEGKSEEERKVEGN